MTDKKIVKCEIFLPEGIRRIHVGQQGVERIKAYEGSVVVYRDGGEVVQYVGVGYSLTIEESTQKRGE